MKPSITPIAGMAAIVCLMAGLTVPRAGAMPPVSAHPPHGSAPDAGTPVALANGRVVETMNSGGYTYVLVDDGSKQLWAAAPEFTVAVGDLVKLPVGSPMANFHSKTLDRTFELVHFVPSVEVLGQPAASNVAPTDVKVGIGNINAQSCQNLSSGTLRCVTGIRGDPGNRGGHRGC